MSEQVHRRLNVLLKRSRTTEGKITIFTSLVACLVLVCAVTLYSVNVPVASADNVTSSVTVLNTPPTWTVDAQESAESSTSTPTNAGQSISWTATGTDSSNDNYYLLICKTSGSPTANSGAAPSCNGGISNQWAVSPSTASGAQATAATTTTELFAEKNDWYAWICDNNSGLARCNLTMKQGSGLTASPFVVNHPPVFTAVSNNSPQNPGGTVTWTTTATDTDLIRGGDTIRLVVCKTQGNFNGTTCTTGGIWATSTFATFNPSTSTPITIPYQDKTYAAYAYIADQNSLGATSTLQGTSTAFVISNVAPTIAGASVSLVDTDNVGNLTLLNPASTTSGFKVQFTVADNNGCQNSTSSNEIAGNIVNVYRSGITQASCQTSGNYNSNNCYPAASPLFAPFYSCTQDGASCSGASDSDATFTCTFSLWFNADPTDASTQFTAENWLASVRATDDNGATSALTESSVGNDLASFLAFDVATTTVAYGALQPGDTTTPLFANTDLQAQGNTGLDESLYGDTMCTTWSGADSCDAGGPNAGTKIPVSQQVVATGTVAYDTAAATTTTSAKLQASTTPISVAIHVPKTTATSSIQTRNTYWGIAIPTSITLSGNYTGQNTIIGVKSAASNW